MSFQDPVFRRGQQAVADASPEATAASSASPEPKKAANKRGRKATKTQKQPCREEGLSGNFFLSLLLNQSIKGAIGRLIQMNSQFLRHVKRGGFRL